MVQRTVLAKGYKRKRIIELSKGVGSIEGLSFETMETEASPMHYKLMFWGQNGHQSHILKRPKDMKVKNGGFSVRAFSCTALTSQVLWIIFCGASHTVPWWKDEKTMQVADCTNIHTSESLHCERHATRNSPAYLWTCDGTRDRFPILCSDDIVLLWADDESICVFHAAIFL